MSKLKSLREAQNLTQEELSQKSGVSVRTIQRIETGKEPKGYTLRVLAEALAVAEQDLIYKQREQKSGSEKEDQIQNDGVLINYFHIKLINLSSVLFVVLPPLNIFAPIILMLVFKQKNKLTKQIISLQILWTIIAPIVFILGIFLKLGKTFTIFFMAFIALTNVFLIISNAISIDKNKKLCYHLDFNMI